MKMKTGQKLDTMVNVRFPAADARVLTDFAANNGMTMGALVRQLVQQALPTMVRMQQAMREVQEGEVRKAINRLKRVQEMMIRQAEFKFPAKGGKKNR